MFGKILLGGFAMVTVAFVASDALVRGAVASYSSPSPLAADSILMEQESTDCSILNSEPSSTDRLDLVDPETGDVAFHTDLICVPSTCYKIEWIWGGHNRGWMKIRVAFSCAKCWEIVHPPH